ncbi:MAG TPA: lysozyme inhibitor LprI family protein [Candidatus Acidoferrum sp.]
MTRAQCEGAKSTLQINECFAKELKKAEAEVNKIYQLSVKKLEPDDAALLRKAQRAWLAYRDAQCEAEHALWGGGTGGPAALMSCRVELTRQRVAEIQNIYEKQ